MRLLDEFESDGARIFTTPQGTSKFRQYAMVNRARVQMYGLEFVGCHSMTSQRR
eukprot:TRINITY_DN11780_c0_g1_i1.p2 TRINITY_DN11780_c0_g1~~TRINITY_DN11780_c0_g1_i1.p2  ORF type:complete len:54 (+),score=8.39 TRINITY_DN11780_c0_g1_i1:140-301(+)